MPWGRCDDGFYRHGKVQSLRETLALEAVGLYWLAISWCNDQLTDGRVPASAVRLLGAKRVHATELVRVGLWEIRDDSFVVHDFLQFNKSKAQVLVERAAAAERQAKSRDMSQRDSQEMSQPESQAESQGDQQRSFLARPVSRLPSPVTSTPKPAPFDARDGLPNLDPETIGVLEELTGRGAASAGWKQLTELDRLLEDHPAAEVQRVLRTVAGGKRMTARQLVWPAVKLLEPFPDPKALQKAEIADGEKRASDARFASTQRLLREQERLRGEA